MATSKFRMPQNFSGFPSCIRCGSKNFTRVKGHITEEYYYKCDVCHWLYKEKELGIDSTPATEDKILHPHIKAWNSSKMRNEVAETVHNMEKEGSKPLRVRKPWEL